EQLPRLLPARALERNTLKLGIEDSVHALHVGNHENLLWLGGLRSRGCHRGKEGERAKRAGDAVRTLVWHSVLTLSPPKFPARAASLAGFDGAARWQRRCA